MTDVSSSCRRPSRAAKRAVSQPERGADGKLRRCDVCKMPSAESLCNICVAEKQSIPFNPFDAKANRAPRGDGLPRLQALPPELVLQVCLRLDPLSAAAAMTACSELEQLVRENERLYWRTQLERRKFKVDAALIDGASVIFEGCSVGSLDLGKLYRLCFTSDEQARALEARGMSVPDAHVGEQNSWWKCHAVGLTPCPHDGLQLVVRFAGYTPEDDEARPLANLRRLQRHPELQEWRKGLLPLPIAAEMQEARKGAAAGASQGVSARAEVLVDGVALTLDRLPGTLIEVSWAVRGHPTAKWQAVVHSVQALGLHLSWDKIKWDLRLRYVGFEDTWDECVAVTSARLFPHRPNAVLRLEHLLAQSDRYHSRAGVRLSAAGWLNIESRRLS